MNLDRELRSALERDRPSPGFSGRVMSHIRRENERERSRSHPRTWLRTAAALVLVTGFALGMEHQLEQKRRRQLAEQQLQTALQITASKLDKARHSVLDPRQ